MELPPITVNEIVLVNKFYTEKPHFASKARNTHILGYQISGEYRHNFNGKAEVAKEDTVIFINKNTDYRVETKEPGTSIAFHFTVQADEAVPTSFLDCTNALKLKKIFFGAYEAWQANGGRPSYMIYSKIYEALEIIGMFNSKNNGFSYVSLCNRTALCEAVKYINEHLYEKINVEYLAHLAGKSERRFNDLFKNGTGKTPLEYINDLKLDAAKRYLEIGAYSVSEISHMLGFPDESYFNRLFKSKIGVSPGKYRKFIAN